MGRKDWHIDIEIMALALVSAIIIHAVQDISHINFRKTTRIQMESLDILI